MGVESEQLLIAFGLTLTMLIVVAILYFRREFTIFERCFAS